MVPGEMASGRSAKGSRPGSSKAGTSRAGGSRAGRARAARTSPRAGGRSGAADTLSVRFWGVRGSIASPGPATHHYGGNTPCVEVRCGRELLVFDLGSGVRQLGEALAGEQPLKATLFVSHYHYDHLQGLPFFRPLFDARNAFVCYGPTRNSESVRDILARYLGQPFFPVGADAFRAQVDYRPLAAGERLKVGGATVTALELHHPGGNLGYRVDYRGRSVVYATDLEHGTEADARLAAFAQDTDLLIYDAMYTEAEYAGRVGGAKRGWGHSTWEAAVVAAERARAKQLVLFHHEPTRDDAALEHLLQQARARRPDALAAREGETLVLG